MSSLDDYKKLKKRNIDDLTHYQIYHSIYESFHQIDKIPSDNTVTRIAEIAYESYLHDEYNNFSVTCITDFIVDEIIQKNISLEELEKVGPRDILSAFVDGSMESIRNEIINKSIKEIETFFNQNEEYEKYHINYVLVDKEDFDNSIAVASDNENVISVKFNTNEIYNYLDWAFNYDEDLYKKLEEGKEIWFMNMETHYNIWTDIQQYFPEDIEYKTGVLLYMNYCKENDISKETIEHNVNLEIYNIMNKDILSVIAEENNRHLNSGNLEK